MCKTHNLVMCKVRISTDKFPNKTIDISSNDVNFHYYKALLYQELGEYHKALLYAEKAYELSRIDHVIDIHKRIKELIIKIKKNYFYELIAQFS